MDDSEHLKIIVKSKELKYQRLDETNAEALKGGGNHRIEAQHKRGKLTARERLELLLDKGSFNEIGKLVTHRSFEFGLEKEKYLGDGVITGFGPKMHEPHLKESWVFAFVT